MSTDPSQVVALTYPESGVAVVALEDREHKNMFSASLCAQFVATLKQVEQDPAARVILVHGFDTWFCCGGTEEELDAIRAGNRTFNDDTFFRALLDSPLPTIAAMQGHALGGGLVLGLYADMIVLAEQALYAANFMDHGFTPGMGATYIVPKKLGQVLGSEMLFSGRRYRGSQLKERGVSALVTKKGETINEAMELARNLATKPQLQLRLLKKRVSAPILAELPSAIEHELAMHAIIFEKGKQT